MSLDILAELRAVQAERTALLQQRRQIDTRLATIDAELGEVRRLLGTPAPIAETARQVTAALDRPPTDTAIVKPCELCEQPFEQRSPRQKICQACRDRESSHRSVDELAGRDAPRICQNPRCGKSFTPTRGSAGRFCSRPCYQWKSEQTDVGEPETRPEVVALTPEQRDARILAWLTARGESQKMRDIAVGCGMHLDTTRDRVAQLKAKGAIRELGLTSGKRYAAVPPPAPEPAPPSPAPAPIPPPDPPATPDPPPSRSVYDTPLPIPKRRCARCVKPFQPTRDREYICPACLGKKAAIGPAPTPAIGTPLANESVTARDMAILRALQNGPRDEGQLVATISGIGKSDLQMALRRLEMREKIIRQGERWRRV